MRNEVTKKDIDRLYSGLLKLQESVDRLERRLYADQTKELLTPSEVCELLGIKRRTYQTLVKRKIIVQMKPGGKINSSAYVAKADVDKILKGGIVDV